MNEYSYDAMQQKIPDLALLLNYWSKEELVKTDFWSLSALLWQQDSVNLKFTGDKGVGIPPRTVTKFIFRLYIYYYRTEAEKAAANGSTAYEYLENAYNQLKKMSPYHKVWGHDLKDDRLRFRAIEHVCKDDRRKAALAEAKAKVKRNNKERYHNDPEYRALKKVVAKQYRADNTEKFRAYAEKAKAVNKERYHNDPEYRALKKVAAKQYRADNPEKFRAYAEKAKAVNKERYHNDPEYKALKKSIAKQYYESNKAKIKEYNSKQYQKRKANKQLQVKD